MKKKMSVIKIVMIAMSLVAAMSMASYAAVDMTGKWSMEVKNDKSTGTPVFDLTQSGKTLTGSYNGKFGTAPVSGTIEGNAFKLSYTLKYQGNDVTTSYMGKVTDNTCQGDVDYGKFGKATFTGKK